MKNPETVLKEKIVKALRKEYPTGFFVKIHGSQFQHAGLPDLICCVKGRFIGMEIKTPTGEPTLLQLQTLRDICRAEGQAVVVRSCEEALKAVRDSEMWARENKFTRTMRKLEESKRLRVEARKSST